MKKKFREITVNKERYCWSVNDCGEDGAMITIWKDKKVIYSGHFHRLLYRSIMPSTIRYIIENINGPKLVVCPETSQKCACGHSNAHLYYDHCKDVGCVPITEGLKV